MEKASLQLVKKANDDPNNTYGFVFATSNGQERKHFLNKVQEIAPKLIEQNRLKIVLDISKLMGYSTEMNNITKQHFSRQLEQEGIVYSKAYGGIISSPIQSIVDIYMQPSESEGLPLSVVESLIVGTPVIASNVGGIPDIVNGSNGLLVDLQNGKYCYNAEIMMDAFKKIEYNISNKLIKSPKTIRNQIINRGFTTDKMVEDTLKVYDELRKT